MAKRISSLSILLGLNFAPLVSGIRGPVIGALKSLGSAAASAGSTLTKLSGIGAAVAAIGGAAGIGLLVKDQFEAIASTTRLADTLGISTEALVGFQEAGKLAGLGADEVNGGLEKMLKNIGKAAIDGGELAATFQSIGLDAVTLANQSPAKTFDDIADAIKNIGNPAERARAETAIFGREGQKLGALFAQGSEGIAKARAEAEALGVSFSRIDGQKVIQASQGLSRVGSVIEGIGRTLVIGLAPYIEQAANVITSFGIKIVSTIRAYLPLAIDVVRAAWSQVAPILETGAEYALAAVTFLARGIQSSFATIAGIVSTYAQQVIAGLTEIAAVVWNTAQPFITLAETIGGYLIKALTSAAGAASGLIPSMSTLDAVAQAVTQTVGVLAVGYVAWQAASLAVTVAQYAIAAAVAAWQGIMITANAVTAVITAGQWALAGAIGLVNTVIVAATTAQWLWTAAWTAGEAIITGLTTAMNIGNVAAAAWATVTGVVTAAQWLLNVALDANPIGIVVIAVGAIVAGLTVWAAKTTSMQGILDGFHSAVDVAGYSMLHLGDTAKLVGVGIAYEFLKISNQAIYFFSDVIPGTLRWFAGNWRDIFTTIWNFTTSVFENMGTNIGNFFTALWSALKGDGFNFKWTGLLTGFENTVKEMPAIAARQIGPLEGQLGAQFDALSKTWHDGLDQYKSDRDKAVDTTKADWLGDLGGAWDAIKGKVAGFFSALHAPIKTPEIPVPKLDIDNTPAINAIDEVKKHAEKLDVVHSGSAESLRLRAKAIADAMLGSSDVVTPRGSGANNAQPSQPSNPQPAPVASRATEHRQADKGKVDDLLTQLITLMTTGNKSLTNIDTNTQEQDVIYTGA